MSVIIKCPKCGADRRVANARDAGKVCGRCHRETKLGQAPRDQTSPTMPSPVKWSKMKPSEKFERMWREHGYQESDMVEELEFSPDRKYRFDFAWPSCKVAVEVHGFGYGHQAQQLLAQDCEKIRHAIELGWLVVPFTTRCISSRDNCYQAVAYVCQLLSRRHAIVEIT